MKGLVYLSYILRDRGYYDEAEQKIYQALHILRDIYPETGLCIVNTKLALAKLLDDADRADDAAKLFPDIIDSYITLYEDDQNVYVANARSIYGDCLRKLEQFEAAAEQLQLAFTIFTKGHTIRGKARLAASRLATLYETWGDNPEAARWRSIEQTYAESNGE